MQRRSSATRSGLRDRIRRHRAPAPNARSNHEGSHSVARRSPWPSVLLLVGLLASLSDQALAAEPSGSSDSIRFRSEFGLSTDTDHVQALEKDAKASRQ